jgi:hypothetical protein
MITRLPKIVDMKPIIDQVDALGHFDKRLVLNETTGKLLNGPYTVKAEFQNTPIGNLLESIGPIGEARLLKLQSSETYTAHCDPDDRIHLAIVTNPFAYVIDLDKGLTFHMPVDGQLWLMDTGVTHVAANFGGRDRIHLNIRVPLPSFTAPGYSLRVEGGDYDWKQETYITLMKFFNRSIKEKQITGFEKVDEREVLLNCDSSILTPFIQELESKGLTVKLNDIL